MCVGALLTAVVASTAHAQERGFAVHRSEGSTAGSWLFVVDRPWYSDTRWFAAGLTIDGALNPLVPAVATGRGGVTPIVSGALLGRIELAGSFFDRVLLRASLPVTLLEQGTPEAVSQAGPLQGVALGDPRVGVMVRLLGQAERDRFSLHVGADLWIPVGGQSTHQGDATARFLPRLVLAGAAGKARWTVDAGFLLRSYASIGPPALGMTAASEARLGFAFGFALADERLSVGPEVQFASQVVGQNAFAVNGMSLEVLGGAQVLIADRVLLGVAVGAGFLGAAGTPDARALVRLAWAPRRKPASVSVDDEKQDERVVGTADVVAAPTDDADGDGVRDGPDRCPYEPETRNGVRDEDGCPEYELPKDSPLARVLVTEASGAATSGAGAATAGATGGAAGVTSGAGAATAGTTGGATGAAGSGASAGVVGAAGAATSAGGAAGSGVAAGATGAAAGATGAAGGATSAGAAAGSGAAAGATGAAAGATGAAGGATSTGAAAASGASGGATGGAASTTGGAIVAGGAAVAAGAALTSVRDADGDGIADDADRCPVQPEDADGFEDEDGCPELDNDRDGIADADDRCPLEGETLNGIDDSDGCPDVAPDADKDGVADAADRCPFEPETLDGIRDDDGCPELQGPSREALAQLLAPPVVTAACAPSAAAAEAALTFGLGDADHDGILDEADRCPVTPEDADGFEDDDGCPEPDNDADGIADANDKCPVEAETVNGWADEDGCPDEHQDIDSDRVLYERDRCPYEVGDSADGCPHPDLPKLALPGFPGLALASAGADAQGTAPTPEATTADFDGDGMPDDVDSCPVSPEDLDGFEDEDGCPEPDNDSDGILDAKDKCPFEAETINGVKDDDGCPDKGAGKVSIQGQQVVINGVVLFAPGSARLTASSLPLLKQVASTLKAAKSLTVEIQGHTDDVGSAAKNIRLSQQRAEAIRKVLIKAGVADNRLTATGYGPTRPRASNKTPKGREQNRRVEFLILGESK